MEIMKPRLTIEDLAQMMDFAAVQTDSSDAVVEETVRTANQYHGYLVTCMPAQTLRAKSLLQELPHPPKLGGNVGFPSGAQTTRIKVAETAEFMEMGVDEIDMVMNVAAHLSGRYKDVRSDIAAVVTAAQGKPVKVILECHYLSEDQIRRGCDLIIEAGAAMVKTATGWAPSGATLENIALIKSHVGDAIGIKAAGGVRGFETLMEMYRRGARRFGVSAKTADKIFKALSANPTQLALR